MTSNLKITLSRGHLQMQTNDWIEFAHNSSEEDFEAAKQLLQQHLPVRVYSDAGECDYSLDRDSEFAEFVATAKNFRNSGTEE